MSTAIKLDDSYMNLIRQFPLAPIRTERQYKLATAILTDLAWRLNELTNGEKDYLSILTDIIANHEKNTWKRTTKPMTPSQALKFLVEESNRTQTAIAKAAGIQLSNFNAYLSGSRPISKDAAIKLGKHFKVSAEIFLPR